MSGSLKSPKDKKGREDGTTSTYPSSAASFGLSRTLPTFGLKGAASFGLSGPFPTFGLNS